VLAPFTGMPTRNPGYFYSFRRGVYYGEHFPWIYSEAYGWCYVYHYEFQSIYYIIGGGLKINSPLEKEINGWYKLGPMHLVVKSDESFPYVYWGQDIQSIDTGETIHVNLRWMECEVKFYKLQPVAGTDATR